MNEKRFNELLNNSLFLSLFYNARKQAENKNIPLEAGFMEYGLNKYKTYFLYMCENFKLNKLTELKEFDIKVREM